MFYSSISITFLSVDAIVSFCEFRSILFQQIYFSNVLINSSAMFQFSFAVCCFCRRMYFCKLHNFPKRCMRSSSYISFAPPLMSARGIAAVSALSGTGAGIQRNCCGHFFLCFSFVCFFCTVLQYPVILISRRSAVHASFLIFLFPISQSFSFCSEEGKAAVSAVSRKQDLEKLLQTQTF